MTESPDKKRKRKERWPVRAYGSEWKELWLKASRTAFHIDFRTSKDLNRLRLMAQRYRNQQKQIGIEEGTVDWELLYLATTTVEADNPLRLHFRPVAAPHFDYFAQAGIEVGQGKDPEPEASPPGDQVDISELLKGGEETSLPEMDAFMEELLQKPGREEGSDG